MTGAPTAASSGSAKPQPRSGPSAHQSRTRRHRGSPPPSRRPAPLRARLLTLSSPAPSGPPPGVPGAALPRPRRRASPAGWGRRPPWGSPGREGTGPATCWSSGPWRGASAAAARPAPPGALSAREAGGTGSSHLALPAAALPARLPSGPPSAASPAPEAPHLPPPARRSRLRRGPAPEPLRGRRARTMGGGGSGAPLLPRPGPARGAGGPAAGRGRGWGRDSPADWGPGWRFTGDAKR